MFEFIKNNRYFVITFILLIACSFTLVFFGLYQNDTPINKVIQSTKEQQEEQLNKIGINDFFAQYVRDGDDIHFNWHHNIEEKNIETIQIYNKDQFLVDVTNYSSYRLNRESYHILPGENEFKIVINTKDENQYELSTKVLVNYVVNPNISVMSDGYYYYLTFTYDMSVSKVVEVPNMIVLDNIDYERVHTKTTQQESNNLVKAATTYQLNIKEAGIHKVNVRFFFEEINDSFDFEVELKKQEKEGS